MALELSCLAQRISAWDTQFPAGDALCRSLTGDIIAQLVFAIESRDELTLSVD
jgi:hypothetical protein